MSRRFNELLSIDYGLKRVNQAVIYQPFDPVEEEIDKTQASPQKRKVKLLFVGRISVRKGLELLVELSHRLDDMVDQVEISVVGGPSFWSDYTSLMKDLNPRIANFLGPKSHDEVKTLMSNADVLLVPSHYEPGGIVVAEALSHGCMIVASDEVGSAEPLAEPVCRKFQSGNVDQFETQVRSAIEVALRNDQEIRIAAKDAAAHCFDFDLMQKQLVVILSAAASSQPICNDVGARTQTEI